MTLGNAKRFHELLSAAPDFAPAHEPECNIVCFRHIPEKLRGAPAEKVSAFQQALRRKLVEDGRFYTTSTRLDGEMVLRVTLMHPLTGDAELAGLLETLREIGASLT